MLHINVDMNRGLLEVLITYNCMPESVIETFDLFEFQRMQSQEQKGSLWILVIDGLRVSKWGHH